MRKFLAILLIASTAYAGNRSVNYDDATGLVILPPHGVLDFSNVLLQGIPGLEGGGGTTLPPLAQAGFTDEIWITNRTDGLPGTGTQADPFNGASTAYDTKMQALATAGRTYLTIHFGPGTFTTNVAASTNGCAFFVQSGWTLKGAGRDVTTVQMTGSMLGKHFDIEAFKSDSSVSTDNVTISDLTIDCNASAISATADTINSEKAYKSGGIFLFGNNNLIQNVRVKNSYGSLANSYERFDIGLNGPVASDGKNNWIRNCVAETPTGNYGAPFALFGFSGHPLNNSGVVDCQAYGLNNGLNSGYNTGGVNLAFLKNAKIDRNTFVDCYGWAYIDTGTLDGLELTNNMLVRGWAGFLIQQASGAPRNITIAGNTGFFQNRDVASRVYGIRVSPVVTSCTNILIENNRLHYTADGGMGGTDEFASINVANGAGVRIINNTSDAAALAGTSTSTSVQILGNRSFASAVLTGLEDGGAAGVIDSDRNSALGGSIAIAGTYSPAGEIMFAITAADYTIVAGDRLRYEVYCDPGNAACYPTGYIRNSDATESSAIPDQNNKTGYYNFGDGEVSGYARGKWYSRDFDLTSIVGKVAQKFRFGETNGGASGNAADYFRNVRIVSPTGVLRRKYYLDGDNPAITNLVSLNVSSFSAGVFAPTIPVLTYATLPSTPAEGMQFNITDSNTSTWGATAAAGGSNHILVRYNGTDWTVVGK